MLKNRKIVILFITFIIIFVLAGCTFTLSLFIGDREEEINSFFKINYIEVEPEKAWPEKDVTVTAEITNKGEIKDTQYIRLYFIHEEDSQEKFTDIKRLTLSEEETKTIEFKNEIPLGLPIGEYEIIIISNQDQAKTEFEVILYKIEIEF